MRKKEIKTNWPIERWIENLLGPDPKTKPEQYSAFLRSLTNTSQTTNAIPSARKI